MKKILRKRAWITVMLAFVLAVPAIVLSLSSGKAASTSVQTLSLFETSDNVDIILNQKSHTLDFETGVLLSTSQNGAKVSISETLTGVFSLDFKVFSAQSLNVSKIIVSIADANGLSVFDYIIEHHSETQVKSCLQKNGTEISNSIMTDSSFLGANHNGIRIGFDQAQASITVNGSEYNHSLQGLNDLAEYKAAINFIDVDGTANILLYRLMGQSLQGSVLTDDAAPSLYINEMTYNGIAGEEFALPSFKSYDVIDKGAYAEYSLRVLKPNHTLITLAQQTFSFIPDAAGSYKALYTVKDSGGFKNTAAVNFEVFEENQIVYEAVLKNRITDSDSVTVGKGTKYIFPSAEFRTNYARSGVMKAELTIDGNKFDAASYAEYTFDEIGSYNVKYSLKETVHASPEYSVRFDVIDAPAIIYPKLHPVYSRGEIFSVPPLTAAYGGAALQASHKLYFPDGSASAQSSAELKYTGEYRLDYSVKLSGTDYKSSLYFAVVTDINTLITDTVNITYRANVDSPFYADDYNGIELTSTRKDSSFTYGNIIDFSGKTKDDTLLEFLVTPTTQGVADIPSMTVRLTDVIDPNNYISVFISGMYDSPVYAAYKHSILSFASAGTNTYYANRWGVITTLSGLGTASITSFHGVGYDGNRVKSAKLSIDYADRAIYILGDKVLDLDDPLHVGGEGKEWNGFFSDKAILSITFNGEGSVLLLNVDGQNFSGGTYADVSEKEIFINCNEETPTGLAGSLYAVFSAYTQTVFNGTAFDYQVQAFRNYGIAGAKEYQITNGYFTPDVAGIYTLVYTSGQTQKTVNVTVSQTLSPLALQVENSFFDNEFYAGEQITLPIADIFGGSNRGYITQVSAISGGNQFTVNGGGFTPVQAGQYTIKYTVTDYVGNTDYLEKTLNVVLRNAPFFIGQPNINNGIMLSDAEYTLPVFGAFEFIEGSTGSVQTTVGIKQANGSVNWLGADRKYKAAGADKDIVTIVYRAVSLTNSSSYTDIEIPVTIIKPKNFSGYFYGEGIRGTAASDYIRLESDNDAQAYFVNALPAEFFNFDFSIPQTDNAAGGITFTLTDSENPAISLSFGLFKTAGNAEFYLNGSFYKRERVELNGDWTVRFNRFVNTLENSSGIVYASLKNTLGGEPFDGFPSQKIMLSIKLENVSGLGYVNISQLCGQALSSDFNDRADPIISYRGIVKSVKINQTLQIPKIIVADVIDPNATGTVRVAAPNGTVLLNNATVEQSYFLQLTMYGKYSIRISIEDASGNQVTRILTVTVRDEVAPELSIGSVPQTGKAGQRIELPSAAATDNADTNLTIDVYLIAPDGTSKRLSDTTGFVPDAAGTYRIRYYVQDSYLNYDMLTFTISVE